MSPATIHPLAPPAQPGPITDEILEHAANVAEQAVATDNLTTDGAALLMALAAPALRELLQWRRRMAVINDMSAPGTVILFPGTPA